jgi:MSHA biogenesis protein MshP
MFPDNSRLRCESMARTRQRGFSIVTAIFLLVVMAGLGAYMLTFSTVQQTTSAQDLQGSRAYQAARAGVEFGVYEVTRRGVCAATTPVTLAGTLAAFSVTVKCAPFSYTEAGHAVTVYQITSTAFQTGAAAGSPNFVERQIIATVGL